MSATAVKLSLVRFFLIGIFLIDETHSNLLSDDGIGVGERGNESTVEGVVADGAGGTLGTASLASLVLEGGLTVNLSLLGGNNLVSAGSLAEGVKLLHHVAVLERVLLGLVVETDGSLDGAELGLNLVRVDDSGEVGTVDGVTLELVSTLLGALGGVGAEDVVEAGEGIGGEDDESSEVTAGGELEEVDSVHVARVDTGEVTGASLDVGVLVSVDDQGSLAHGESGVAVLSFTVSHLLGFADSVEVLLGAELVEGVEESTGGAGVHGVGDERELGHIVDTVTTGLDERSAGGGGEGGSDGVSLLVGVYLSVPFSPDLEGSEHATLAALVTEGGLAGTVGTGARNTGNSSNGTTGTPRLSRVLVTLEVEHSVSLTLVLAHVGVDERHDIVTDGGGEDGGHGGFTGNLGDFVVGIECVDTANWAGGHSDTT